MAKQSKLYGVWAGMKQRCMNPRSKLWPWYGAKGITVCEEWAAPNGFWPFSDWALSHGYQEGLCIDRIDNAKGYEPSNCRWTTRTQNLRNRTMTAKWLAHIHRIQAVACRTITDTRRETSRKNMAKARASRW